MKNIGSQMGQTEMMRDDANEDGGLRYQGGGGGWGGVSTSHRAVQPRF